MTRFIYNHKRDLPDERDIPFQIKLRGSLPPSLNLRDAYPMPVLDQGNLGSCTANASSNALRFCLHKEGLAEFQPSRLFIYFFSRFLEGTISEDSGAAIRDVMKAIATFGACSEIKWSYDTSKFTTRPSTTCIRAAKLHTPQFEYQRVEQDLNSLKTALVSGFPIVFGIQVYASLEADACISTGIIPMPKPNEACLGGHCILMIGYNDADQTFTILNSWGASVGKGGIFTIPYAYVINDQLSSDFWVIRHFI